MRALLLTRGKGSTG